MPGNCTYDSIRGLACTTGADHSILHPSTHHEPLDTALYLWVRYDDDVGVEKM